MCSAQAGVSPAAVPCPSCSPNSSPNTLWWGWAAVMRARMASSAFLSAMVTGLASSLFSTSKLEVLQQQAGPDVCAFGWYRAQSNTGDAGMTQPWKSCWRSPLLCYCRLTASDTSPVFIPGSPGANTLLICPLRYASPEVLAGDSACRVCQVMG